MQIERGVSSSSSSSFPSKLPLTSELGDSTEKEEDSSLHCDAIHRNDERKWNCRRRFRCLHPQKEGEIEVRMRRRDLLEESFLGAKRDQSTPSSPFRTKFEDVILDAQGLFCLFCFLCLKQEKVERGKITFGMREKTCFSPLFELVFVFELTASEEGKGAW